MPPILRDQSVVPAHWEPARDSQIQVVVLTGRKALVKRPDFTKDPSTVDNRPWVADVVETEQCLVVIASDSVGLILPQELAAWTDPTVMA